MAPPLRFSEFASLPARGAFLYALQASDGLVKVGQTSTPRNRMGQHARALQQRGVRIVHLALCRPGGNRYHVESELMARMRRIGTCRAASREWFEGVCWGSALTLLRQVAPRQVLTASRYAKVL